MAGNWKTAPLEELVSAILDRRGLTPLKLGSNFTLMGHRVVSAKLIKGNRLDLSADEPRFVDAPTYRKWMQTPLLPDDVILTSEAPLGERAYIKEELDWCLGQRLFGIRTDKSKLLGKFLFYALGSESVSNDLVSRATGTTVQGIRQSELRRVQVPVPPLADQRGIAKILGDLDDRIALNRCMNETLEAMARAIFKDWFVEFGPTKAKLEGHAPYLAPEVWALFPHRLDDDGKPEGWHSGTLGDIAVQVGDSANPETLAPDTPYIGLEHMPRRSIALDNWEGAGKVTSGKLAFKRGDLLFGKLRPYFHKVGIAPIAGICSTDIVVLNAKVPSARTFVISCISQDEYVAFTDQTSDGTKMPRTSWGRMARYAISIPPPPVLESFDKTVSPMFDRIIANIHESRVLAATRDLLLPKLMSGDIRVRDAERVAEAVL